MKLRYPFFSVASFLYGFLVFILMAAPLGVEGQDCDRQSDSLALVELYEATGGEDWTYETQVYYNVYTGGPITIPNTGSTWNFNTPINSWHGVALNNDGCVEVLALGNNNLTGILTDLNLPTLKEFYCNTNNIEGSFPDFSNLENLQYFNCRENQISDTIPNFQNIPLLEYFNCDWNEITGNIPDFSNLQNLKDLFCGWNNLTGEIPNFSKLSSIEDLYLIHNNLSGSIPNFDSISTLIKFRCSDNNLSGKIPDFNKLPNLEWLTISENQLTDTIPNFNLLPKLVVFGCYDNNLSGIIPEFSNLSELEVLDCDANNLTGLIPDFTNLCPKLRGIYLDDNHFTFENIIPSLNETLSLIDSNAWLPQDRYDYDPQDSIFTDTLITILEGEPLTINLDIDEAINNSSYLWYKNSEIYNEFDNNQLIFPNIQPSDAGIYWVHVTNPGAPDLTLESYPIEVIVLTCNRQSDSLALLNFYEEMNGIAWTYTSTSNLAQPIQNSGNSWNPEEPIDTWHGVTLNEEGCVEILTLGFNNLSGILPDLELPRLREIYCQGNSISGEIPNFSFLPNLTAFWCAFNNINGEIPNFTMTTNLQDLFCFNNELNGGIPNFSSLPNLKNFDCSSNSLTGEIPNFTSTNNLESFVCFTNDLNGSIPNFDFTTKLQHLSCGGNELVGNIPDFSNLDSLEIFNCASNQLSGCYPDYICDLETFVATDNPNLPWQGDHTPFCNGESQTGAPCDDGNPNAINDTINADCSCGEVVTCDLTTQITTTPTTCQQPNGTAMLNVSNSTGPLSWTWSNGSNDPSIANLVPGTYTVTLTDDICEIVISGIVGFAESPEIAWSQLYGGSDDESLSSLEKLSDGNYLFAGSAESADGDLTTSGNQGLRDVAIAKISDTGALQWYQTYGGSSIDVAQNAYERTDGSIQFGGYSFSDDGDVGVGLALNDADYWAGMIDCINSELIQKMGYGDSAFDQAKDIQPTNDGGAILVGQSNFQDNIGDFYLLKLHADGSFHWQQFFGDALLDRAESVIQLEDDGYLIVGLTNTNTAAAVDVWVMRTDELGNQIWQTTFGGTGDEVPVDIQKTQNGNFIIAAHTTSLDGDLAGLGQHGEEDIWVFQIDDNGNLIAGTSHLYGGSDTERPGSILPLDDNSFLVTGFTQSTDGDVTNPLGDADAWILKLNESGALQWQQSFGGSNQDEATAAQQMADGCYLIGGNSDSNDGDLTGNNGEEDQWIFKLSPHFPTVDLGVDTTFCEMTMIELVAYDSLCTNCDYIWSNGNMDSIQTINLTETDSYSVTISTADGCTATDEIDFSFVELTTNLGDNIAICEGNEVDLDATVNNCGNCAYLWLDDNSTNPERTETLMMNETYIVQITAGECVVFDTTMINVTSGPTIPILAGEENVCQNTTQTYTIINYDAGFDYQWISLPPNTSILQENGNEIILNVPNNAASGQLCVQVTAGDCPDVSPTCLNIMIEALPSGVTAVLGETTICGSAEFCVTAIPDATTYNWSTPIGNFSSATNCQIIDWTGSAGGEVCVVVENNCGENTVEQFCFEVINHTPPEFPQLDGPMTACNSSSVIYSVLNPQSDVNYSWFVPLGVVINGSGSEVVIDFTAAMNGEVCVTALNTCGQSAQNCLQVTINDPAVLTEDVTICEGEVYSFAGEDYGVGVYQVTLPTILTSACDTMVNLTVNAISAPVTETFEEVFCPGEISMQGIMTDTIIIDTIMTEMTSGFSCDSLIRVTSYIFLDAESIEAKDDEFIAEEGANQVEGNILDNDVFAEDGDFIFTIISALTENATADIDNDNQLIYSLENEGFTGTDTLLYTICQTDCPELCDTAMVRLIFDNNCFIAAQNNVPDGFSPNEDGINDFFHPLEEFLELDCPVDASTVELTIINRWGDVVFRSLYSEIASNGWDGRNFKNNKMLPEATYYYHLSIPLSEEIKTYQGAINLLK